MDGLIIATVLAGIILVAMGLLHLGSMIKFIPFTITSGFTAGIAVTIVIGQIKDFMGLTFEKAPVETMEKLEQVIACFGTLNVQALAVGLISLAILIIWPRFFKKIPPSLIAVLVSAVLVKAAGLNVNTIGDLYTISSSLPAFHLPEVSYELVKTVLPDAFTIAILAAIESLLSCVVADGMIGSRHNSNMELVAQGLGNVGSALFGGYSGDRGNCQNRGQYQEWRNLPCSRNGPCRRPSSDAAAFDALCGLDSNAGHCGNPVHGGL